MPSTRSVPAQDASGRAPHVLAIGDHACLPHYTLDLRTTPPDVFEDLGSVDWSGMTWATAGRPYQVDRWAAGKREWEAEHARPLPVAEGWRQFNASFHQLFLTAPDEATSRARAEALSALARFDGAGAREAITELVQLTVWNRVHRVEDAVWDPRGKRALFGGLDLVRPRILFLGAADGYEAMQLAAMYPGAEVVLVDYDDFCRTDRFGKFPEAYPFLGVDPSSGHQRLWYREEMDISFEVADIRDLRYGREFDSGKLCTRMTVALRVLRVSLGRRGIEA